MVSWFRWVRLIIRDLMPSNNSDAACIIDNDGHGAYLCRQAAKSPNSPNRQTRQTDKIAKPTKWITRVRDSHWISHVMASLRATRPHSPIANSGYCGLPHLSPTRCLCTLAAVLLGACFLGGQEILRPETPRWMCVT